MGKRGGTDREALPELVAGTGALRSADLLQKLDAVRVGERA
jgi:hypothetical protein